MKRFLFLGLLQLWACVAPSKAVVPEIGTTESALYSRYCPAPQPCPTCPAPLPCPTCPVCPSPTIRPGSGGTGNILTETWDTAQSKIYYEDDPTPGPNVLTFSHALSIDGNDRGPDGAAPLRNQATLGSEIISFAGRKVVKYWTNSAAPHSVGTRVVLTRDRWHYDALLPWANHKIFGRFYIYFPGLIQVASGGSWITAGTQFKTTDIYSNAVIQMNYDEKNQVWWGSGPNSGVTLNSSQRITWTPNVWHKVDFEWDMVAVNGRMQFWIDGVKVADYSGMMANAQGIGTFCPSVLYGDRWVPGVENSFYLGDVILSTNPI